MLCRRGTPRSGNRRARLSLEAPGCAAPAQLLVTLSPEVVWYRRSHSLLLPPCASSAQTPRPVSRPLRNRVAWPCSIHLSQATWWLCIPVASDAGVPPGLAFAAVLRRGEHRGRQSSHIRIALGWTAVLTERGTARTIACVAPPQIVRRPKAAVTTNEIKRLTTFLRPNTGRASTPCLAHTTPLGKKRPVRTLPRHCILRRVRGASTTGKSA